ncbi:HdeD family acid-resistance protein [Microvirga subterranea]|uniref:Uncharacterized membrane protein HdeD (DUF308 family) n=1 Tax=Microvirga subterranea TaxID=186651 RepID=A0A370HJL4_9HYPH|nr:HdeD family acid-resistance protein [Microvirga subterranea]RDI57886.1 uncharacterized membrane protein HdeD (DUF308 family) [Microvirga subterranea]
MAKAKLENLDGRGFSRPLAESRWWLFTVGGLLVLAGLSALAIPFVASIAVEAVVGWAFVLAGLVQLAYALRTKGWGGFAWQILIGAIFLLGGLTLITNPVAGPLSLTLVIIATFLASGVIKILVGFRLRPMDGWGWFVLLGILSLIIGVLIWSRLPSSAAWSLGLLVGVDFLSTGLVFIRFGFLAGQRNGAAGAIA